MERKNEVGLYVANFLHDFLIVVVTEIVIRTNKITRLESIVFRHCPNNMAVLLLWSPYVIGQAIIFLPCGFFLSSIFLFLFLA